MELQIGPITWKKLSEWFGLSSDYLNKHCEKRAKKLKVLEGFAQFHFEGKKLIIDKVLIPTYSKAYDVIEKVFPEEWGNIVDNNKQLQSELKEKKIDTCSRVGMAIYNKHDEIRSQISIKTTTNYTNMVKVKNYGHNYKDDHGLLGRSQYVWMNQEGTAPLEQEKLIVLNECATIAYGDIGIKIAPIDDVYRNGEISKEERDYAVGVIQTIKNYDCFIDLLIQKLGFKPEKRTQLINEIYFNKENNESN